MNSGANCSVTVQAPSGNISLIGGTTGVDAWSIQSKTGWISATGSVQQPVCRGFRRGSVGLEQPADLLQLVDGGRIRTFGGRLHCDRQLAA